MRIVGLQASNFKRLKAVAIHPDPASNTVIIAGNNAQGKTSVLDAIWATLGGGDASRHIVMPIREGQPRADVQIDLGEVIATRTWTSNEQSYLKLKGKDGNPIASPQTLLDSWFGNLTFDPLAFSRLEAKQQREELLKIAGVDQAKIDELASRHNTVFIERSTCNRSVKDIESQLASCPLAPDAPQQKIIMDEMREKATLAERENNQQEADKAKFKANKEKLKKLYEEMRLIEEENGELYDKWKDYNRPDIEGMWASVRNTEEMNRKFEQNQRHFELEKQLLERRQAVQGLTQQLEDLKKERVAVLNAAAMPIHGLSVDEERAYFNGIPFNQLSSAEQLRVSLAIAMARNTKLKVVFIRDGSLLDAVSTKMVEEMATQHGYQVWMEVVDGSGERGITIEDGMVKSITPSSAHHG